MNIPLVPSDSSYLRRTIEELDAYEKDLWHNLDRVPCLPVEVGQAVLIGFLEQACRSQNIQNILIGQYGILSIPRDWVLEHIEELVQPIVEAEDDYEYRRLFEVYEKLDKTLAHELAQRALASPDSAISEAGEDFLERLAARQ